MTYLYFIVRSVNKWFLRIIDIQLSLILFAIILINYTSAFAESGYKLPFPAGTDVYITTGNTQSGISCIDGASGYPHCTVAKEHYAWDMRAEPRDNTVKIVAARSGIASVKKDGMDYGCGTISNASEAAYVVINHGDGTSALYLHLANNSIVVDNGQYVKQGQIIGTIGNTGWSCGTHLHFQVQYSGASWFNQSISTRFDEVNTNNGVPQEGLKYLSANTGSFISKIDPYDTKRTGNITIIGNNFGATPGIVKVAINSLYSFDAVVTSWSDTGTIITAKIFNDSFKWENFTLPVNITVYKSSVIPGVVGEAIGSASFPFKDVPLGYWADEAIQNLYRNGIVNGNGSGQFLTLSNVTRAEFLTMLLRAKLGYSLVSPLAQKPFDDVPLTGELAWFAPYAYYAKNKSYVSGNPCADNKSATCFRPTEKLTRYEASVMATKVFELMYYNGGNRPTWPDWNEFDYGYAPWIAYSNNVMNGYNSGDRNGYFGTNDFLTRDQAAVIINNAIKAKP